jgi:hypothetical protein
MDYSKLAEGIFSALGAEDEDASGVESEISSDVNNNTQSTSIGQGILSSNLNRGLAALSIGGMVTGGIGAIAKKFTGDGDGMNLIYTFLLGGLGLGLVLMGRSMNNFSAEQNIKKAEALVKATERYIRTQAEQQSLDAEAEAEAKRAEEQTNAAKSFFGDSKTNMGLGIDFSNPFDLSGAMGNIGDFNASSGRNTGVVLRPNPSSEKFKWI